MSILIKNATIIQPNGAHHLEKKDLLIEKGTITKIASNITTKADKTITGNTLHISIGWLDIGAHSGEPGFEHRETLVSLKKAAVRGGYSAIAVFPNTQPTMDNSTALQLFKNPTGSPVVDILPIGALSKGTEGNDIAELYDMHEAGATAFSDGLKSVDDNGLMMRALQYAKAFNGTIIHHPNDPEISSHGQMHEGAVSTSLGLTGIPTMTELSHVERDISLLDYTDSKMLLHLISSAESVRAIKLAKKKNKKLYSSVAAINLSHDDTSLQSFDSNYKVQPPLRTNKDQKALIKAIKDGTIDIICSNHKPLENDLKKDAFQYTTAGIIGLQTCFAALYENCSDDLSIEQIVHCLAIGPRRILQLDLPEIKKGNEANITVFDLDEAWNFDSKTNRSLANNSPFMNTSFKAKVKAVINGRNSFID